MEVREIISLLLALLLGFISGGVVVFIMFLVGWIKIFTIGGGGYFESHRES
jgi:hypothetical protein